MAQHHRRLRSTPVAPQSTLTETSAASALRFYVYVIAVAQIVTGIGYVFGAPASAPSLLLMAEVFPIGVWGAALVLGGGLILVRQFALGHGICALVCLPWAIFAVEVLLDGTATGWGWGWPLAFATVHGYSLFRTARSKRAALIKQDGGE